MNFEVGDIVVHRSYGPGEVIELDEKTLSGQAQQYYVVKIQDQDMTLWVPVDGDDNNASLRLPTPAAEFEKLFYILKSAGQPLSNDRLERKNQLQSKMRAGDLESICYVIRDLNSVNRLKKLNSADAALMERAQTLLLNEWKVSLKMTLSEAQDQLRELLAEDIASTLPH